MNRKYCIDASAWIEYFEGSERGRKVAEIVESQEISVITSSVTVSEIVSKFLRSGRLFEPVIEAVGVNSIIVAVSKECGVEAGKIHFEAKKKNKEFGMLDALTLATAREHRCTLVTSDDDFKTLKGILLIR